ncbi:tRNA uridine-5-carboxymethylaminomethyl(34) synthesis enzyme MnmG [Stappia sp.]|uniref:tRNA uridine-5-carboxymethylaminomethyl(34) synthesis enzyme MnmG n=1 Tax=Stappia sp. TaxID=1870903 RepID=UPI003A9937E6
MKHFDVIVIGGGHAGAEAADAAARAGAATLLVTLERAGIGVMSCNPAIGGLGKGHLVREVDAFDGVMGRVADRAGIQFRLLNRSKGPAVQGPRAQSDRHIYRAEMLSALEARAGLEILEGEVSGLILEGDRVAGVRLADGSEIRARATVLTTGTFLRGVIHIGDSQRPGGRMGDAPSVQLAHQIDGFGLPLGRLKTGTPPRLDGRSINWDGLEMQPGDDDPVMFSFLSTAPTARQVSCGITHTNERTHDVIRDNLARSAMYGGQIEGIGPRYCPSIEDKIVRFSEKTSHQVFLEPESLSDTTIYPNGISTSLPQDVQEDYIRTIQGLEHAKILQPGYAIEYDYVNPQVLDARLSLIDVPGLFLAGQINGTTGYEEAAAQGLVAGLNAAREAQGLEPIVFSRADSYIGVMIDDLITRGVSEPYRMFTSRAEFRLSLRADNADQRLTPMAIAAGCVSEERRAAFECKMERLDAGRDLLQGIEHSPKAAKEAGINVNQDGKKRTAYQLLSLPNVSFDHIRLLQPESAELDAEIQEQLVRDAIYANYIERQTREVEALRKDENVEIPQDFDYFAIRGLSTEQPGKLVQQRPGNLAQAAKIDGMTPAALVLILARLRQAAREKSA